ncbi:MAG: tetratricopeptide repeat protein [Thiohalophilus sp.]|uniref:tetratricopeptide repeat protein n=1 Tax=Thiohalophilus sp. TaxID=3028392 RepID=UPI002870600A|nr:tetratricopeptide repeat protein [Thiohalophilus sp.]MDR9437686.1 tetratricopeptide repeat protein [Thiohalophilus sp.]
MTNYFYKILVVLTALAGIGFSAPLMADAGQFKLDMILAERGDADAQYYVANAYEEGRGTEEDMGKAFEWYRKAAAQQHGAAQYKLGVMYENGMGVETDLKQAMEWYKQAAENGNTLARERMNKAAFARSEEAVKKRRIAARKEEQRQREQAEKQRRAEEQKRKQAAAARAREAALREKREQQARARAAQQKQAAAASSKPASTRRVNIPNLAELVLNNKWQREAQPADFLPSASTHCLSASDKEVVCFSSEKQRVINGMRVTYTTKATLTDFNADGSFQVRYNYNAVKLDQAGSRGMQADPHGLKPEQGWQEPQLTARCQTSDRTNLYCRRGNIKLHYQR